MRIGKTFSMVNLMGSYLPRRGLYLGSNSKGLRLLVSSEYDPWSILEMTYTYLSGSAPMVFHSPHLQVRSHVRFLIRFAHLHGSQVLVDLQAKMKSAGGYLGANITEAWKRKYQVEFYQPARVLSTSHVRCSGASWEDTPNDEHVWHRRIYLTRFQDVCYSSTLALATPVLTSPTP